MDENYVYKIPRQMYITSQKLFDKVLKDKCNLIRKLKNSQNGRWERFSYKKGRWIVDFKNNFILEK